MGSIQILLGRSRARRRRAIPAEALSGIDPAGRPTFLYVTSTWRKKQVVERDFVAWRADDPVFAPEVRVFDEMLDELFSRFGSGHALLSRRALGYLVDRVLHQSEGRWPWLDELGDHPTVGTAIADLHLAMAAARQKRLDGFRAAEEVMGVLGELERAVPSVHGHISRPEALEVLLERLERPPPALVQWLRRCHSVLIDDLIDPSPLERAVLVALCRAWAHAGAHVVLSLETGRGLGGAEVESFFEYGELDPVAVPLKPFRVTRALRRTLFEELVATGEASIHIATQAHVFEVEPASLFDDPEPADLSDHLYGPRPVICTSEEEANGLVPPPIRLTRYRDPEAEAHAVAGAVKERLLAGAPASSCVIAVCDPETYAQPLAAALADHGIPFATGEGDSLERSPLASLVIRIAGIALADWPVTSLLNLLASDLIACPVALGPLAKAARRSGIRDGHPLTWCSEGTAPAELEALTPVITALEHLATDRTARDWQSTLLKTLEILGVPERISLPPETSTEALSARTVRANLAAWGAILRVIDGVARDLSVIDPGVWSAAKLVTYVERAFSMARYRTGTSRLERVQVIDAQDVVGLTPRHTWLVGLTRLAFPRERRPSFLVPRSRTLALELPDALGRSRYLFCSLLRNAIDDRDMETLHLSWPETVQGRAQAPSPVVEDLLSLPVRVGDGGIAPLGQRLDLEPIPRERALARTDALHSCALEPSEGRHLPDVTRALVRHQAELLEDRCKDTFGRFDGLLAHPPPLPPAIRITSLETYLKCPARYWYAHVLGLERTSDYDPDLGPAERGTALHAILESFIREVGTLRDADIQVAGSQLHRIAEGVITELEHSGEVVGALADAIREEWLGGLIDRRPAGLLKAWLQQELSAAVPLEPESVEVAVSLSLDGVRLEGRIDRIDRTPSGDLVISDYKTGRAPSRRAILLGLAVQPIAYAEAITQRHPQSRVATAYYELRRPETVRRKGWVGDGSVLSGLLERWEVERSLVSDTSLRGALMEHAAAATRRLAAGVFHPTLAESSDVGCQWCDFRSVCRVDPVRGRVIAENDAEGHWQRPYGEDT